MPLNNILLVDDDDAFNFLNKLRLKENKVTCNVIVARDGREALECLMNMPVCPDVILLDINMPGVSGFEFLEQFEKLNGRCIQTKIYMLTTSDRDEDKLGAMRHRLVSGYFGKPLSDKHVAEILAVVN